MIGDNSETDAHERGVRQQRELDAIDFNIESSGQEPVRMRRFIALEDTPKARRQREAESDTRFFLQLASAASIERFQERLGELDRASILALNKAEKRVSAAEDALVDIRSRATRDSEGRLIYRTRDGSAAFYEDETRAENIGAIGWRTDSPTWEQRKSAAIDLRGAQHDRDEIGAYRDRLHTTQQRLEAGDGISEDELKELEQSSEQMPASVAESLREMREPSLKTTAQIVQTADYSPPKP